jgi:ketosteroid isomerase-like protein
VNDVQERSIDSGPSRLSASTHTAEHEHALVIVLIRNQRQSGRHTGICTELPPYAQVFTMREGKVVRRRTFPNQESALEAVGLSPGEK